MKKFKYNGRGKDSHAWRGYGDISLSYLGRLRWLANKKGLKFNINLKQMWNLFLNQNGKCALTGEKLKFSSGYRTCDATASLDRIDSSKGYELNNIQWLHKEINELKSDFPQNEFVNLCKKVANNNP